MSDWNQRPLEAKEVYYAALDAYATRAVAVECMHMVLGRSERDSDQGADKGLREREGADDGAEDGREGRGL